MERPAVGVADRPTVLGFASDLRHIFCNNTQARPPPGVEYVCSVMGNAIKLPSILRTQSRRYSTCLPKDRFRDSIGLLLLIPACRASIPAMSFGKSSLLAAVT